MNALSFYAINSKIDTTHQASSSDSLKSLNYSTFLVAFATSISENKNWQSTEYKSYSFLGNVDYSYKTAAPAFKKLFQFRGELGFLKFVDSIWYKNSDNINIAAQWTNNSAKSITHSYSIILKSQFTDTWKYSTGMNGEISREWLGGILNPATLTIAYGLNYDFWKYCFFNLAPVAVKINTRPLGDDPLLPGEKELSRTKKSIIVREYGLTAQSSISKKIYENISWDSKTHIFSNGISKNRVTLDFQNRITFSFPKYIQFRADSHIVYDPVYSYRLQYKQEILFGVSIEKKK
jgi:hypothetical protein